MKKMVFMAAFVAAGAAFVACSSNDDLVQQKPDVSEEMIEEGTPMTIIVSDLASRGTDIASSDDLENFTLYSTMLTPQEAAMQTPPAELAWKVGKLFGKDAGGNWTTNGVLAWPDDKTYTFYGISDVGHFSDLYDSEGTDGKDNHADVPVFVNKTGSTTEKTLKFSYAIPTDYAEQVDLLVSENTGSSTTGDPAGSLTINLTHALAQLIKIKVYCNADNMVEGDVPLWRFRVNSIKLGGLKAVGTYTFDASTPWTVFGDDEEFEIPLDIPADDEAAFNRMTFQPGAKSDALELPLTDKGLYLIPQSVTGSIALKSGYYELTGAYAEMELQAAQDDEGSVVYYCWDINKTEDLGVNWDYESSKINGYQKVRVPLTFDITGGSGKGYTLVIDLTRAICIETGEGSYRGIGDLVLGESIDIQI